MRGAVAARLTVRLRPLSFLMREGVVEARLRGAAQRRQLRRDRELRRQFLGEVDGERQAHIAALPFRLHGQGLGGQVGIGRHVEAQLQADALVGRRHRGRDRLAAAEQRRGPARRRAVDRERVALGRQAVILQPQRHRRGGSRPHRHRRVIGEQIEPLDVLVRLRSGGRQRKGSEYEQDRDRGCFHRANSLEIKFSCVPPPTGPRRAGARLRETL